MGFSTFGGDIFRDLQMGEGAKCFFGQFVFDVASVTCVIVLSCVTVPFMSGHRVLRLDAVVGSRATS